MNYYVYVNFLASDAIFDAFDTLDEAIDFIRDNYQGDIIEYRIIEGNENHVDIGI